MAQRGRRKAEVPGNHTRGPVLLALVALVAGAVTAAALLYGPGPADDAVRSAASTNHPSPSASQAPLDLSNLPVGRMLACRAVDDEAVVTALGGPVSDRDSYASGDRVEIVPGVTDVAHEDSCTFGTTGAEARVWVFAAPVGTAEARRLVHDARTARRCTFPPDATGFGTPGVTGVCRGRGKVVATLRGLFGNAWLSCELSVSARGPGQTGPDAVRDRADRWCVHVATTLGARP